MARAGPRAPSSLLGHLAYRWVVRDKAVFFMVSLGVALSVAVSFVVSAVSQTAVQRLKDRVVGSEKGEVLMWEAAVRAFRPWQAVSLAAAVVAALAVACVLLVVYVGKRRSFGIMKIMGLTGRDLVRVIWVWAAWPGATGVALGLVLGSQATRVWFGPQNLGPVSLGTAILFGLLALGLGALYPRKFVREATPYELLRDGSWGSHR